MAEDYVEKVANELATLALADEKASGDIAIVDQIGEVLGASSQTLQESYNTAIRVRRAEKRARALLADRAASGYATVTKPDPAPQDPAKPRPDIAPETSSGTPSETPPDTPYDSGAKAAPEPDTGPDTPPATPEPAQPAVNMPRRVKR